MSTRLKLANTAVVVALVALLCVGAAVASARPPGNAGTLHQGVQAAGPLPPIDLSEAENCDFITQPGSQTCMVPFPDNYYTVADPTSATGRRVNFKTAGMPANAYGQHIEAGPYNASDGFSPGSAILLKIPGINTAADVAAMGSVPINKLSQYAKANAPVVVIDVRTGQRWPIWTEIDSNAEDSSKAVLEIHPAVNFNSGDRYIVALRNLKNAAGEHLQAPAAFQYYRDDVPSAQEPINEWRPHYEELFSRLEKAGIGRSDLYLAWDFTVASDQNNTSRELSMRNNAFAQLGDTNLADGIPQGVSPTFEVTKVENEPNPGQIARRVDRHVQRSLLPVPQLRAGRDDASGYRRKPDPERNLDGQLRLHHPRLRHHRTRRQRATVAVRARVAGRRLARWPPVHNAASPRGTKSSSARPTRSAWPNRTSAA